MLNTIKEWWPAISFGATCIAGGAVAFMLVTRVRVPTIENRLSAVERTLDGIAHKLEQGVLVKSDMYDENHIVRFVGRQECGNMRHSCADGMAYDMREIKAAVEKQTVEGRATRTVMLMFAAAVKEKMGLKFEIPEIR